MRHTIALARSHDSNRYAGLTLNTSSGNILSVVGLVMKLLSLVVRTKLLHRHVLTAARPLVLLQAYMAASCLMYVMQVSLLVQFGMRQ
jgi:hypothetical protein